MVDEGSEITEEMVAELKKRLGMVWRPRQPYFNTEATRDSIRYFCHGIGDMNPLFTDRDYAKKSRYGRLLAPPCYL